MAANVDLRVGQTFQSHKDFDQKLWAFQEKNYCLFVTHKSDKSKTEGEYDILKLRCKHFGKPRANPNLTGERPMQKTYKIGCTALMNLSTISGLLTITDFKNLHNHPCNAVTYYGYPEVRRMSQQSVEDIKKYTQLRAKPMLMKPLLKVNEGNEKMILSRDIHNIRAKQQRDIRNGRSDEEMLQDKLLEIIQMDPDACAHIEFCPETMEVQYILVQTSAMRRSVQKFPEVLLMDLTYKINKNLMPVSVIQVVDGAGVSQVAAYAILANEQKTTLTEMLLHFRNVSGGEDLFMRTDCVVVDKDFSEIGAIRAVFPNAKIHICSVHTERNVKKAAKGDPNKAAAMEAFRGMLYAETEEEFQEKHKEFKSKASKDTYDYFRDNWLTSAEAWCLKDRALVTTFRNHSTNRVEGENQKLKMALSVDTPLYEAVGILVDVIQSNRQDALRYKDHEAQTKHVYLNNCDDEVVETICNDLTLYAAKLLCEQYQLARKPSPAADKYVVSESECSCMFFKTLKLTCRHITRYRKKNGLDLYSKQLIPQRYWLEYNTGWWDDKSNKDSTAVPRGAPSKNPQFQPRMPAKPVSKVLDPREKFKEGLPVIQQLQPLLLETCGTRLYYERLQFLRDLVEAWSKGQNVSLLHISSDMAVGGTTTEGTKDTRDTRESDEEVITIGDSDDGEEFDTNEVIIKTEDASEEENDKDKTNRKAPFKLNNFKRIGRPRGMGETIHDGSKKSSTLKRKSRLSLRIEEHSSEDEQEDYSDRVEEEDLFDRIEQEDNFDRNEENDLSQCAICGNPAGDHRCTECGKIVHIVEPCGVPDPDEEEGHGSGAICTLCAVKKKNDSNTPAPENASISSRTENDSNTPDTESISNTQATNTSGYQLKVVRTKGRPKTTSRKYQPSWGFKSMEEPDKQQCGICNKECEESTKCKDCKNYVHGHLPCSLATDSDEVTCNYCSDISFEQYHGHSRQPGQKKKGAPYFCFGCQKLLRLLVARNPTDIKRTGDFYYGCMRKETDKCLPMSFWAPKEKSTSDVKTGLKRKAETTSKTTSKTPVKKTRSGRTVIKNYPYTPKKQ